MPLPLPVRAAKYGAWRGGALVLVGPQDSFRLPAIAQAPATSSWRSRSATIFSRSSRTSSASAKDWFNHRRLLEPIGNTPAAEAENQYYAAATPSIWQRNSQLEASGKPGRFDVIDKQPIADDNLDLMLLVRKLSVGARRSHPCSRMEASEIGARSCLQLPPLCK